MDIKLLEHLAGTGSAEAQYALGTAFLMGEGVPQDASRAVSLFRLAAEQGEARAQCNLGAMFAQGIGVPHDYDEARRWYEESASKGNSDGLYNLAVIYAQGLGGCVKNIQKARKLCEKAASQGQDKAQAMLKSLIEKGGDAHEEATAVTANDKKSKAQPELHGTAADVNSSSMSNIAVIESTQGSTQRQTEWSAASGGKAVFDAGTPLELRSPNGSTWQGLQRSVHFPKPGSEDRFRSLYLLKGLASEAEVAGILHVAQTLLEFNVDNDSVDQRPTYERYVVQVGQYVQKDLEPLLRPIIEDRILPFVREKYSVPDAVVCTALVRRYLPDERRVHPTHLDGHALCTAVLGLNAGEFRGGLYAQPEPETCRRQFVDIGRGDLAVHQYDLPHGVRVFEGRRYSLIFWVKDCIASCVTNATPWYEAAAKAGDADAMTAFAQKLSRGMNQDGVGSDVEQAAVWYKRAAELGQVEAQTNLGSFFETGRGGLEANGPEALRWWRKGADAGDSGAQRMLALAYSSGSCGVPRNDAEALRWMNRAAEQEDMDAMYFLGLCYSKGTGTAVDVGKGHQWMERAADMGHAEAQYGVGAAFLAGEAVAQDMEAACNWFRRAALNGNACAQCNLGAMYAQGLGALEQDYVLALRWYRASAERGNADGQHNLALMYFQGLGGIDRDESMARDWCEKAAAQGQPKAIAMLRSLPPKFSTGTVLDACPPISEDDAWVACKAAEVRSLLLEIDRHNAGNEAARSLLAGLVKRVDAVVQPTAVHSEGLVTEQRTAAIPVVSAAPAHTSCAPRVVEIADALECTAEGLAQRCRGRKLPLLVRSASAAHLRALSDLVNAAGEDAVEWEVQREPGQRSKMEGSLEGFLDVARICRRPEAVLMYDGSLLDTPALAHFAEVPFFLAGPDRLEHFPKEFHPAARRWLVAGSERAKCCLHRSPPWTGWDRLLCGEVHWRLLPPDALKSSTPVGCCGAEASDLDAFSRADALEGVQLAGDVMMIPCGWWLQTSHVSGPTVSVSSQTFDDQSASEFLRNIQASMAIPSAPSTGDLTSDIRRITVLSSGKRFERPDRRAALCTTRAAAPLFDVVRPLCDLDEVEIVD